MKQEFLMTKMTSIPLTVYGCLPLWNILQKDYQGYVSIIGGTISCYFFFLDFDITKFILSLNNMTVICELGSAYASGAPGINPCLKFVRGISC